MRRTLLLSLLVLGAAVALALGTMSVLADKGGPGHGAAHGVATGLQDDGDGDEVVAQQDGDDSDGEGAQRVAQVIADTFGVPVDEVLALHESDVGFGAIFKLYLLSAAGGGSVEELSAAAAQGDEGFAFGERFKELAGEVSALSAEEGMPKNLGQAVSGANKADKAAAVAAVSDGDEEGDEGPPDHAPAHGFRR